MPQSPKEKIEPGDGRYDGNWWGNLVSYGSKKNLKSGNKWPGTIPDASMLPMERGGGVGEVTNTAHLLTAPRENEQAGRNRMKNDQRTVFKHKRAGGDDQKGRG